MKSKSIFIVLLLGISLFAAVGAAAASSSVSQGMNIALNNPVTAFPGNQENKRYFVTLPSPGSLQLSLEFVTEDDYYFSFYSINRDGSLNKLFSEYCYYNRETVTGTFTREFDRMRLPAGTYIIEVESAGSYNEGYPYTIWPMYRAELSDTVEKENNDKARDAMTVPYNTEIIGNLGNRDDDDYYRVDLPFPGTLKVEFRFNVETTYYVDLLSVNRDGSLDTMDGQYVYFSGETLSDMATKYSGEYSVPAGPYYLHISSGGNYIDSDYQFTFIYRN